MPAAILVLRTNEVVAWLDGTTGFTKLVFRAWQTLEKGSRKSERTATTCGELPVAETIDRDKVTEKRTNYENRRR